MADPLSGFGSFLPDAVGMMGIYTQIVNVIVTVGIIAAIAIVLLKFKILHKYPVEVEIWQVKNGRLQVVGRDKARRVQNRKDGEEYYDVKKRNFKWYPPTFQGQTMMAGGKKTKIYVVELSHNEWKIVDPASLISATPEEYKNLENESTVRFWKNIEDDKADLKWKKTDNWQKLREVLPTVIMFVGMGIFLYFFGTYVVVPVMSTFGGVTSQSIALLERAIVMTERSTQYIELLLAQNGIASPYSIPVPNESVIV